MKSGIRNEMVVDPGDISGKLCRDVYDYWNSKRGNAPLPCWCDLDLMDIYHAAPFITVKDAIDGGEDFRNRYFGSGLANLLGYDGTGQTIRDNFSGEDLERTLPPNQTAFNTGKPVQTRGRVLWKEDRDFLSYDCLIVPVLGSTDTPEHLITVFDFETR